MMRIMIIHDIPDLLSALRATYQREDEKDARIKQLEKHILDTSAFYRKTSGEIEAAIANETQEEFDSLADSYRRQTAELAAVKRERDAAVTDALRFGGCKACKNNNICPGAIDCDIGSDGPMSDIFKREWRGPCALQCDENGV